MRFIKTMMATAAAAMMFAATPVLADEFSDAQKAELDGLIRAYILENPEVIVEAMQVLEQRQQQAQQEADSALVARLQDQLMNDGYSFVGGNPDGDITVVEFSDYRCPYCKQAHDSVQALLAADPNVRYILKEFPILGPDSTYAARAAMAAQAQGKEKFEAFSDAMMRHQGDLPARTVLRIAETAGLDSDALQAEMENPAIAERIRATYSLAREMSITGTPAFVVGGEIVRGFVPFDTLREMVETARDRG